MIIVFYPKGTCSRRMTVEVINDTICSVVIEGGCPGNLQAVSRLVQGMRVTDAIEKLDGIRCGHKATSCPDQLAQALKTVPED